MDTSDKRPCAGDSAGPCVSGASTMVQSPTRTTSTEPLTPNLKASAPLMPEEGALDVIEAASPPPLPFGTPPLRRVSARNTPTLRSATRDLSAATTADVIKEGAGGDQLTRCRSADDAAEAETRPAKSARKELDVDVKALKSSRTQLVGARKRTARDSVDDDKKADAPEKIKRTWEKWSAFDKNVFFEALGEVGKDFEAMQNYIAKKKNKIGSDQIRNRDQIRFFYYRNLNKIAKYVHFESDVKRVTRELYTLINYGELRKRCSKLNERVGQKLNELVHRGGATIRLRGKTCRIRTPVCRALKTVNKIHDPLEESQPRLPARACVELVPADNATWYEVQALSHNPRLRVSLPLQYRIGSLVQALERRWRTRDQRTLESASVCLDEPSPAAVRCVQLSAAPGYTLTPYIIRSAAPPPAVNLSLDKFRERMCLRTPSRSPTPPPPASATPTVADAAPTAAPATPGDAETATPRLSFANVLDKLIDSPKTEEECDSGVASASGSGNTSSPVAMATEDEELRIRTECRRRRRAQEQERTLTEERERMEEQRRTAEERQRRELEAGWTAETAEATSVGELYMLMGRPEKIRLLYRFIPAALPKSEPIKKDETDSADQPMSDAVTSSQPISDQPVEGRLTTIARLLSQLIGQARLAKFKNDRSGVRPPSSSACGVATVTCGTQTPPLVTASARTADSRQLYYLPPSPPQPSVPSTAGTAAQSSTTAAPRNVRIAPYRLVPSPQMPGEMPPPSIDGVLRSLPRFSRRPGRPNLSRRGGQVVVQRMLPIMPRAAANQLSMVNLQLVPSDSQTSGKFVPHRRSTPPPTSQPTSSPSASTSSNSFTICMPQLADDKTLVRTSLEDRRRKLPVSDGRSRSPAALGASPVAMLKASGSPSLSPVMRLNSVKSKRLLPLRQESQQILPDDPPVLHIPDHDDQYMEDAAEDVVHRLGPPSAVISSDLSLGSAPSDLLMDVNLANSNSSFTGFLTSLVKSGTGCSGSTRYNSMEHASPPASPRVWNEIGDFSLSSILGHLETSNNSKPMPSTAESSVHCDVLLDPPLNPVDIPTPAAPNPAVTSHESGSSEFPTTFSFSNRS